MQFGLPNGFWFYSIFPSDSIPKSFFRIWHSTRDFFSFSSALITSFRIPSPNLLIGNKGWHIFIKHLLYACTLEIQWWGINNYWSLDISCRVTEVRQRSTWNDVHCDEMKLWTRLSVGRERSGEYFEEVWSLSSEMIMKSGGEERDEQRNKNIYWLFIIFWALWIATFLTYNNSLK